MHPITTQHVNLALELGGTLMQDAQIRTRVAGNGRTVSVLRLDIENHNTTPATPYVVEQEFPELQYNQCEQLAKQLIRGRYVTFDTAPQHMRIIFPNVSKINIV